MGMMHTLGRCNGRNPWPHTTRWGFRGPLGGGFGPVPYREAFPVSDAPSLAVVAGLLVLVIAIHLEGTADMIAPRRGYVNGLTEYAKQCTLPLTQ